MVVIGQDDGGSVNGAGEASAPGFVASGLEAPGYAACCQHQSVSGRLL